jgi:MFS family permease
LLTGLLDWRWVFLVNLPVCAAALALTPRVLTERREPVAAPLDLAGAMLATLGLGALVLGLSLAPSRDALLAVAAATVALAAFIRVEAGAADPLLSRAILRRPGVLGPNLVAVVLTAATTPPMFFCTLYAQQVMDLDPAAAGLLFPPFNLAVIGGSLAGPRVVAAVGERRAMAGGLLAVAAGASVLVTLTLPSLLGGFTLMGAGLGVASVASTAHGTAALPPADRGLASGLLSTSAQVGTVLGLACMVPAAEDAGYELGFVLAAALAAVAAVAVATAARTRASASSSGSAAPSTTRSGVSGGS